MKIIGHLMIRTYTAEMIGLVDNEQYTMLVGVGRTD